MTAPSYSSVCSAPLGGRVMRDLAAALDGGRGEPARHSVSFLGNVNDCVLTAKLNRDYGSTGWDATVGTAFHSVADAVALACALSGEQTMPPDRIAATAIAVLERHPGPLDAAGHDRVMELVRSWAPRFYVPPGDYVAVEELSEQTLTGCPRPLSARMDLAVVAGTVVTVRDYKTGRKKPRDLYTAIMPRAYAWHASRAWPGTDTFVVELDYVAEGRTLGPVVYTLDDLPMIESQLRMLALRAHRAYATGEYPPTPDPGVCWNCAAPEHCPLPDERLPVGLRGPDALAEAVRRLPPLEARVKRIRQSARFAQELGVPPVQVGGERLELAEHRVMRAPSKKALREAGIDPDVLDSLRTPGTQRELRWTKT